MEAATETVVEKPAHVMSTLGPEGDVKKIWDPTKPDEVEDAKRSFNDLRKKGYLAFSVNAEGDKGEQLNEFDPNAKSMIMVPQMQGG